MVSYPEPIELLDIFNKNEFIFTSVSLSLVDADARYLQLSGGTLTGSLTSLNIFNSGLLRIADGSVAAPSLGFSSSTSTGLYSSAVGQLNIAAAGVTLANFTNTLATVRKPLTITNQGSGVGQINLQRPDGLGNCCILRNQSFSGVTGITSGSVNDVNILGLNSLFLQSFTQIAFIPDTSALQTTFRIYGSTGTNYQENAKITTSATNTQMTQLSGSTALPSYSFTGQTGIGMALNGTSLALCTAAAPKLEISSTDIDLRCRFRQNVKITSDASYVLTADNANVIIYDSASPAVWSCPLSSNYLGGTLTISANGINGITINRSGSDTFKVAGVSGLTTFGIPNGNTAELYSQGSYNIWRVNFVGN